MERMTIRNAVKALAPYSFTPHSEPIKLDQNESPDDVPRAVKERVFQHMSEVPWNRYPGLAPTALEGRLAARHGWDPAGVVVANGSNTLIQALTVVSGMGRTVVTVTPTFAVYAQQARLLGADLVEVPLLAGFALPSADLRSAMANRPGVMFLANPAAPTGNLFSEAQVEDLIAAAGPAMLVHPNAVILRTFSKALGLAGARIGFALAHPDVAESVRKALLPFSVSPWQEAVAAALLDEPELVAARVEHVLHERERLGAALAGLPGIEPFPTRANFILFRAADPAGLYRHLLDAGVVIRRQDHLPGAAGCLRVSVGTTAENDAFLAACEAAVTQVPHAYGGDR